MSHALWQMDAEKYSLWPTAPRGQVDTAPADLCAYLGHGLHEPARRPSEPLVPKMVDVPARVASVSAGSTHTLALTEHGVVYIWGRRADMEVGEELDEDDVRRLDCRYALLGTCRRAAEARPIRLPESSAMHGERIVQVCAGEDHSLLLSEQGAVFAFGTNVNGQLGTVPRYAGESAGCPDYRLTPEPVLGMEKEVSPTACIRVCSAPHCECAL